MVSRGRLSKKYALVLGMLVSAALVASGATHGYFAFIESQAALARIQRTEARAAATRITDFIDEVERQVGSVAQSPRPSGDGGAEQRRLDYLRLLRFEPAVAELAYLDSSGRELLRVSLASATVVESGEDRSATPYFTAARSGTPYRGPVYFRRGSEPFMTIALGETGPDAGITVAEVNLKLIWDVISHIAIGRAGYAYVTDARGQLVAHPDLSLVLRQTDVSSLPPVRTALDPEGPNSPVTVAPDLEGRNVLSVSEVVRPTGWLVVVNQPVEEALAPLYAVVWRTALLVIGGVVLSIAASVLLAQRMVAPIRVLQESAARIGAGELEQRIDVRTGDELETLAEEFNRMSAQLRASYASLERKVDERTHELVEVVRALEEKSRQLEIASHHKTEFLANMSHELRTPLNAILGFAEVLLDRPSTGQDERETRYLTNILVAGRHLLALINEILDVAKVEAGRMDLEVRRFSLAQAVENSFVWIQERAVRRRIAVTLDMDPRLGMVEADERKIKQVLVNLLSNAVKFTPDGGRVEVRARRVNEEAHVSVRDTGIGIAQADQRRIFAAFEQAAANAIGRTDGTGLGLAISRRFVELHGGRIWVESALGIGSSFTFAIPLRQPTAVVAPAPLLDETVEGPPSDEWDAIPADLTIVGSAPAGQPKVLAIDNHPMAIEVIEAVLGPEGFQVIPALGGETGLELARREHPSLIILDLIMPDQDGFAVLQRLREDQATAGIPVVVLTSKTLSADERALLAGQVSYIGQKGDFDRAAFIELVRRHARIASS